jgi:hypothetical protein
MKGERMAGRTSVRIRIAAIIVGLVAQASSTGPYPGQITGRSVSRRLAFRMVKGKPFVTAALNGTRTAEFELVTDERPCTVRQELADQIWRAESGGTERSPTHVAAFTIGELTVRNVTCEIGNANTISLSRLGWVATFDYVAREVVLRQSGTTVPPPVSTELTAL